MSSLERDALTDCVQRQTVEALQDAYRIVSSSVLPHSSFEDSVEARRKGRYHITQFNEMINLI